MLTYAYALCSIIVIHSFSLLSCRLLLVTACVPSFCLTLHASVVFGYRHNCLCLPSKASVQLHVSSLHTNPFLSQGGLPFVLHAVDAYFTESSFHATMQYKITKL